MLGIHPHTGPFVGRHPPRQLTLSSETDLRMWSDVFGAWYYSVGASTSHGLPKWSFTNLAFLDGHVKSIPGRPVDVFK